MRVFNNRFTLPVQWMAITSLAILGAACSAPKQAQRNFRPSLVTANQTLPEAPQAAQGKTDETVNFPEEPVELVASTDKEMLPAKSADVAAAVRALEAQNPAAARKLAQLESKIRAAESTPANVKKSSPARKFADKVLINKLKKVKQKFDLKKGEDSKAAKQNQTLVIVGAVLAILGLIFLLIVDVTVGLIFLIIGLVLLIVGALQ